MSLQIRFDSSFLLDDIVTPKAVQNARGQLERAVGWLLDLHKTRQVGFLEITREEAVLAQISALCDSVPAEQKEIVVLGIGGSSLGPQSAYTALLPPWHHLSPGEGRRLHFPDNVDPRTFAALLEHLDLEKTLFLVVSKSGGTAETAAQFMVVWQRLVDRFGAQAAKDHIICITDPEKGNQRKLVNDYGLRSAAIPPNVGGRFSQLTPVGLLPAMLAGIDAAAMLAGGRASVDAFLSDPLSHPSVQAALLYYLHHTLARRPVHVLMPYCDALYCTALWFNQLWGESLGKRRSLDGRDVFVGPTPVAARGATDQHSQLQLYVEGPRDKVVTFLAVADFGVDVSIPPVFGEYDSYSYLAGHSLHELLETERKATALALRNAGRPSATLTLPRLDAAVMGELYLFFEIATALSGHLYGVDPFDQPGVEQGKRYAYGALGRPGFDAEGEFMRRYKDL